MNSKGHQHIFSWKQLVAVMAACAATLYFLLPDDPTLLEKLIEDGKADEAQRQLDQVTPEAFSADPIRYEAAQQRINRLQVWNAKSPGDWEAYLLDAIARWQRNEFAIELLEIWVDDLNQLKDIEPVWEAIARDWALVPGAVRRAVVDRLVALALAHDRPGLAATVHAGTYGESPPDDVTALELARLFRLQGENARALTALNRANSPRAKAMRLTLLRELNQNAAALDQLLAEGAPAGGWTMETITTLTQVARGSAQAEKAIPAVRQFLSQDPGNLEAWRMLVALQRESGSAEAAAASQSRVVGLTDRASDELREWGRLLEGSGQPAKAFDAYAELAARGDIPALERMIALNPGLFRDRELARVLADMVPVPRHDDYTLLLGRILAKLGRYDESIAAYQLYLEVAPRDREALFELGILAIEIYEYQLAVDMLQRIKEADGSDVATIRRLGDAWVKLGEYENALAEYRLAAEMSGLPDDFGNYFRLARVLGDYDGFVAGLEGVVASDEATPSDYLTLAYGYQLLNQDSEAKRVLREGMARFPQNPEIPMRLGYALGDAKRFLEAQEVMSLHPRLGVEVEPTRYYLLLMRLNNDVAAERRFLERDFPDAVWRDPESQRAFASAYLATGQLGNAEEILRQAHAANPMDWELAADLLRVLQQRQKHPEAMRILQPLLDSDVPEASKLAAEVFSSLGRYREAEHHQTRYLEIADPVLPIDWGTLGDIRSSRGDFEGAKRAYRRAVQVFQQRMASRGEEPVR